MQRDSRRTAFVLAGGGSLGAVQVGMLSALVERGVRPDLVVGSSVGALNGAYFAGRPDREGVGSLARIWRGLSRRDVFPLSPLRTLLGLISRRSHLVDPGALRNLARDHLGFSELEQAATPLLVVATDLVDGSEVVLSRGSAADAVLASAAIPGIFPPVRIGRLQVVDGGIANDTPISVALAHGADRVVVLPTGISCALNRPPPSAVGLALHAIGLLVARQLVTAFERYAGRAQLTVVPPLCPLPVSPVDFGRSDEMMRAARLSTLRWIDGGGLEVCGLPHEARPHRHDLGGAA